MCTVPLCALNSTKQFVRMTAINQTKPQGIKGDDDSPQELQPFPAADDIICFAHKFRHTVSESIFRFAPRLGNKWKMSMSIGNK